MYGAAVAHSGHVCSGKPLSLLPQGTQYTCAQSVLLCECPVPEVSPSVVLLPLCQLLSRMVLGLLPHPLQVAWTNINVF